MSSTAISTCGRPWLADAWTKGRSSGDEAQPDLVQAALEKAGEGRRHDRDRRGRGPRARGIETICVITGGLYEQELRDAERPRSTSP